MPITSTTFALAALAIAGIPPFAGFWSKDEILAEAFKNGHPALWTTGMVTALMTSFYMFRLLFMTFFGNSRVRSEKKRHLHESPPAMTAPLSILAILSVVGGIIPGFPPEQGWIHTFLAPVIGSHHAEISAAQHGAHESTLAFGLTSLDFSLMGISVVAALIGLTLAWYFYIAKPNLPGKIASRLNVLYPLLLNKYWVDEIYLRFIVRPLVRLSAILGKFDKDIIDGAVNGASKLTVFSAIQSFAVDQKVVDGAVNKIGDLVNAAFLRLRKFQTGLVQNYALVMILGVLILATGVLFLP